MTFGEFMDKLNELYVGNERDFGNRNVMIATDGTAHPLSELVMCSEDLVLCDRQSAEDGIVEFVHVFIDKDGKELGRKVEVGVQ